MTGNLRTSFNEIKLVTDEGLRITAEAAEYYPNGYNTPAGQTASGQTVISFENFVFPAFDNLVDAKIVANIKAYSTAGDTDVVKLGKITAKLYTDTAKVSGNEFKNFKGVDSKENLLTVDITSEAQDEVTISAVLVTASKMDEFNEGDMTALLQFTVNKGSNHIDNDDIHITKIEFEPGDADFLDLTGVRDTEGTAMAATKS
jgi:hypothetical protein